MSDTRAFPRVAAEIFVRFLINGDTPGEGFARDMSGGGLAITSGNKVAVGDHIVAHLDGGARLEGLAVRVFETGFAIEFDISETRRERLLSRLDHHADGEPLKELMIDQRVSDRVSGNKIETECMTERGAVPCRIIDMSLSGAAIRTSGYIRVGSKVTLGQTSGTIVRREGQINGLQFAQPNQTRQSAAPRAETTRPTAAKSA